MLNTVIDPIELDQNYISIGSKGVVYSFSNTIEHACKHSYPVIIKLSFHSATVGAGQPPTSPVSDSHHQAMRFVHGEGHFSAW